MTTDNPGTAGAPARPVGPYTPVVRAGSWVVCSGQVGIKDGTLVDGLAAQVTQAVANIGALLAREGAGLDTVVKTTVFLADIADYPAMNDAYVAAFGDHRPARSAFAVAGLPLGARVEIEAWAYLSPG
jgi:2-iminobutanoate/2-iminopropanoate deaminase